MPLVIGPFTSRYLAAPATSVVTSLTPFTFSIHVSIGSGAASGPPAAPAAPSVEMQQQQQPEHSQEAEPYIPQTLIIGAFLAVLVVQMGTSLARAVQLNQRRREVDALRGNDESTAVEEQEGGSDTGSEQDQRQQQGQSGTGSEVQQEEEEEEDRDVPD